MIIKFEYSAVCKRVLDGKVYDDANFDFMQNGNCRNMQQSNFVSMLLQATMTYIKKEQTELPAGLLSRLVLGDPAFVEQFAQTIEKHKVCIEPMCLNNLNLQVHL